MTTTLKPHIMSPAAIRKTKLRLFFKTLHIPTAAMTQGFELLDEMIMSHEQAPFGTAPGAKLLAPSNAGKSHFVQDYIRTRYVPLLKAENPLFANAPDEVVVDQQKVVIHVELSHDATPMSIAQDIVARLGEKPRGQQGTLWYRAHTLMANMGVKLLVIDEVQHLASTGLRIEDGKVTDQDLRRTRSSPEALKTIMNRGTVPVVFAGTLVAESLLPGTQFNSRSIEEIRLDPLDWRRNSDQLEFRTFLGEMAIELFQAGFVTELPKLVHGATPLKMYQSSHGRLGLVCRIVHQAMKFVVNENRSALLEEDLTKAVDLFVAKGEISANPFRASRATTLELA